MYATDVNSLVARNAIQAVGRIALRLPARANFCADKLLSLLSLNVDYITSETIIVMTSKCWGSTGKPHAVTGNHSQQTEVPIRFSEIPSYK